MTVRCKFKCDTIEYSKDSSSIKLSAVTSGSKENEEFFKWTPGGQLTFSSINLTAAKQFVPGQDYYIDITLAE